MTSIIKVDQIQNAAGVGGLSIDGNGLILPKVPTFEAQKTSNQSVTSATWTKVTFDQENYDTAGMWDAANSKLIPTVAGYYQINLMLAIDNGTNTAALSVIYKNGSVHRRSAYTYFTTQELDDYGVAGSVQVYCNGTTDYIEAYTYIIGNTPTLNGYGNGTGSTISGHLIHAT